MSHSGQSAASWHNAVAHAALSDIGMRRANNQDSFVVALAGDYDDWQQRGHLFLVADGMGAHAAGELASKMACENIPHSYRKLLTRAPADALRSAITTANTTIHDRGQANAEFEGMGTTTSGLVLLPNVAIVGHVGDSRVYRLRKYSLAQLTFDHSLVWEMMAAGQMPKGDVASFIPKNIITRSLGPHVNVQVDLEGPFELEPGDVFLLCSDGLTGQVKDEEIGAIMAVLPPEDAVHVLVDIANLRGGPDNITALVIKIAGTNDHTAGADAGQRGSTSDPIARTAWGLAGGLALATVLSAILGNVWFAVAWGALGVVSAIFAVLRGGRPASPATDHDAQSPLGAGPHVTHDCTPTAEGVGSLVQMAQQLRELAEEKHYKVDWDRFNSHMKKAQSALTARDFALAMREYALSIRYMMSALRCQQHRRDERDNSVLDM